MAKVLGLDLGTNSLGWALVDESENGYTLIDKGVDIFQEGVAREKNNEKPAVQDRTNARTLRRHYFRRRLRKIELLKVLIRYDLCPPLTETFSVEEEKAISPQRGISPLAADRRQRRSQPLPRPLCGID